MSVVTQIDVTGAAETAAWLEELDQRLQSSPRTVLAELGECMVAAFRANVDSGGQRLSDRGVRWPPRKYPRPWPPLNRTGKLVDSIEVLEVGAESVTVGPTAGYAVYVHGQRPFNLPAEADVDELIARLANHYFARSR